MAVSLKVDGYNLLPLFGVSHALIDKAKACGVVVDQPSPGSFFVKHNGHVFGSIPVKGQAITLAKNGSLGPASKEALRFQFEQALKLAIESAGDPGPLGVSIGNEEPLEGLKVSSPKSSEQPGFANLAKLKAAMAGKAMKQPPKIKILDVDPLGHSPNWSKIASQVDPSGVYDPVKLKDATEMYQPVMATSSGSVYLVVAFLEGLKIAARVSHSTVSFRAEGTDLDEYLKALGDLGFSHKAKGFYSSVHYDIGTDELRLKTFGALIGRLGFDKVKDVGDILHIKGMGK